MRTKTVPPVNRTPSNHNVIAAGFDATERAVLQASCERATKHVRFLQEARALAPDRNAATGVLRRLADILGRQQQLVPALEESLYLVAETTRADLAAIYLVDESQHWRLAVHAGVDAAVRFAEVDAKLLQRALAAADSVELGDHSEGRALLERLGCSRGIVFPLIVRNTHVGAMLVAMRGGDPLAPETFELVRLVAVHVALAVAQAELVSSTETNRLLLDAASDALIVLSLDGKVVDINQQGLDLAGATSRDQVVGHHMHEFAVAGQEPAMDANLNAPDGNDLAVIRRLDGTTCVTEARRVPMQMGGKPHALMIARDVTRRLELEQQVRASEERYRSLVEAIPDVVWCGTHAQTTDVTENVAGMIGFSRDELLADSVDTWLSRVHVDDEHRIRRAYAEFFDGSEPLNDEYRNQHRDRTRLLLNPREMRTHEQGA